MKEEDKISLKEMFRSRVMKNMYLDFLIDFLKADISSSEDRNISVKDLNDYIEEWMVEYFYPEED